MRTEMFGKCFFLFSGSVIVFVGMLSEAFLERALKKKEWFGIISVVIGLAIVGVSDFVSKDTNGDNHGKNDILTGKQYKPYSKQKLIMIYIHFL